MDKAFADIVQERNNQDKRWGVQRHEWPFWGAILAEETGEFCREAITTGVDLMTLRKEAVQVAAVAVAIIEHVDGLP